MCHLKALLFTISSFLLLELALASTAAAQQSRQRSAMEYYNRGNERQQKGDLQGALEDYTLALTFDANFALAWNNRGVVRFFNHDLEAAIADYTKALELKPDYAEAWNNRGNAHQDRGEIQLAILDYSEAIRLNPKYMIAWHSRGSAKYAIKDWMGAPQRLYASNFPGS